MVGDVRSWGEQVLGGGGESARVVLRQRESGSVRELAKGQVDESA